MSIDGIFVPKEMIEICYFIHQIHLLSNPIKERMNNFEEQILQIIMTAILIIFFFFFFDPLVTSGTWKKYIRDIWPCSSDP